MTRDEVVRTLHRLGWLAFYPTDDEAVGLISEVELRLAISAYEAFHGLKVTGVINDDLTNHMQAPRCALPDVQQARGSLARWDANLFPITWTLKDDLPGLSREDRKRACAEAFARWERVSGFKSQYVDNEAEANIVMTCGVIDQSGGTLAWSELPGPGTQRVTQKYDTRESWVISDTARSGIDLTRVACHELGHALGMDHISASNLLAPTYSQTVNRPQAGDIAEMQARYGKPTSAPPTVPPTVPPTQPPTVPPTNPPTGGTMGDIFKALFGELFKQLAPVLMSQLMPIIMKAIEDWIKNNIGKVQTAFAAAATDPQAIPNLVAEMRADLEAQAAAAQPATP